VSNQIVGVWYSCGWWRYSALRQSSVHRLRCASLWEHQPRRKM